MIDPSKRITKPVLIFASKHQSRLIKQEILKAFDGLIGRYVSTFHKKYPEIDKEDLNQVARERALVCIQKWNPTGDSFSFPNYLKQALFFGLRRYCYDELRHRKCMPIRKGIAPFMRIDEKIKLGLENRYNTDQTKRNKLEMTTQSIGYKVSKFMRKLLSDS